MTLTANFPVPDEAIHRDLVSIVGEGGVSAGRLDRLAYARDLWPGSILWMRGGKLPYAPSFIVWPEGTEAVSRILTYANTHHLPVVPFGAGSGVCGGTLPLYGGIVLDLKRMNRIVAIDRDSMTVTAQCGIMGECFEEELNVAGFTLGHFPSSIYCSTLGGWLAARSAGQLSTKYGKIEDMVIAIEAVLADGTVIETRVTPRSATGPDWKHLLVGSEGTLGVITTATMRLHPLPQARIFQAYRFPDVPTALEAIRATVQYGVLPAVVRLYDEVDTALTMTALGAEDLSGNLLILVFEGESEIVALEHELTARFCAERPCEDLGAGPARHWWEHRYDISYRQSEILSNEGMVLDTIEVATVWSNLVNLYETVRKALSPIVTTLAHFSHIYPEGASIYFSVIGHAEETTDEAYYRKIWETAMAACLEAGGTISHHHGIGYSKAPWMAQEHGTLMGVYRRVKDALDPNGILNPGKMGL
ncbi:MAG: FAD-binding oxidoreductase [Deltaproteobacteria bacterium]|nr:MAG: FAD-binding oxidoreductase [Deltaproteobacteria bacterium]